MEAGAGDPDHLPRGDHGPVQGQHEVLVHVQSRRLCDGHLEHDPTGAGDVHVDIRGHRSLHRISLGHDANRVPRGAAAPTLISSHRPVTTPARSRLAADGPCGGHPGYDDSLDVVGVHLVGGVVGTVLIGLFADVTHGADGAVTSSTWAP